MKLSDFTKEQWIKLTLSASQKSRAIEELFQLIANDVQFEESESIVQAICEREKLMSTGIGYGVAIPHARSDYCKDFYISIGVHQKGMNFNTLDGQPVKIIVLIIGPSDKPNMHIKLLSQISKLLYKEENRLAILNAQTSSEILEILSIGI